MPLEIRPASPRDPDVHALIVRHLAGMHESSPAESVHALDVDALDDASIRLIAVWDDDDLAGIGALKRIDDANAELKSMRVADAHLGRGLGRRILLHLLALARADGIRTVWLETGSQPEFVPARALYASEGFAETGPFPPYVLDPNSVFMTRTL